MRSIKIEIFVIVAVFFLTGCPKKPPQPNLPDYSPEIKTICSQQPDDEPLSEECRTIVSEVCGMLQSGMMNDAEKNLGELINGELACVPAQQILFEIRLSGRRYKDAFLVLTELETQIPVDSDEAQQIDEMKARIDLQISSESKDVYDRGDLNLALELIHLRNHYLAFNRSKLDLEISFWEQLGSYDHVVDLLTGISADLLDAQLYFRLGDAYFRLEQYSEAAQALMQSWKISGDPETRDLYLKAHQLHLKSRFPSELQNVSNNPWVTREDFAGLIAWRFDLRETVEKRLMIDITDSWAREAIQLAVNLGILDSGRDYRFRPKGRVLRMDAASAVTKILKHYGIEVEMNDAVHPWDIPPSHYAFSQIQEVLALNIMDLREDGAFHAGDPVSGEEIVEIVNGLGHILDMAQTENHLPD